MNFLSIILFALATSYINLRGQIEKPISNAASQPVVTKAVAPFYPPVAKAGLISGEVVIEGSVHPSGVFITVKTVSGNELLHKAAAEAARQWQFEPYPRLPEGNFNQVRLTFVFRVMTVGTPETELTPVFLPPYKVEVKCVVNQIR